MERRRVACLTMMRDETFFFPIWYRHYASIFGHENLYVIDHLSQLWPQAPDADRPLNVLHIPVEFDRGQRHGRNRLDGRRFRLISTMVEALLAVYDTVIFNDTDEIFITDPDRYRDVGAFLDAHGDRHPAFGGIGLEVVHDPVAEPPFDPALPALGQRSTFVYSLHYAKPHIVSQPCRIGAHGISQPWALSRDLYLVHLKNVDADHLAERQARLNRYFERGSGGPGSEWRWTTEQKMKALRALLDRPAEPEPLRHHSELAEFFFEAGAGRIGGPKGPRRRDGTPVIEGRMIKLSAHVGQRKKRMLQTRRQHLPGRFAKAGGAAASVDCRSRRLAPRRA